MERWLPVPGYEGRYDVSDQGRVRSLYFWLRPRAVPKVLRPKAGRFGHQGVTLYRDGERQCLLVSRLVLMAFVRIPAEGEALDAGHLNDDPTDNRIENLRWQTRLENQQQKTAHGRSLKGDRHPQAKLSDADVQTIRALAAAGQSTRAIADQFPHVTSRYVRRVARGVTR
jgi:hypothetical protein